MRLHDIITSLLEREASLWQGLETTFDEDWAPFENFPCLWERLVVCSY